MNPEVGHLFHDSHFSGGVSGGGAGGAGAVEARERMKAREVNAREERLLAQHGLQLQQAKEIVRKRARWEQDSVRRDLRTILQRTPAFHRTLTDEKEKMSSMRPPGAGSGSQRTPTFHRSLRDEKEKMSSILPPGAGSGSQRTPAFHRTIRDEKEKMSSMRPPGADSGSQRTPAFSRTPRDEKEMSSTRPGAGCSQRTPAFSRTPRDEKDMSSTHPGAGCSQRTHAFSRTPRDEKEKMTRSNGRGSDGGFVSTKYDRETSTFLGLRIREKRGSDGGGGGGGITTVHARSGALFQKSPADPAAALPRDRIRFPSLSAEAPHAETGVPKEVPVDPIEPPVSVAPNLQEEQQTSRNGPVGQRQCWPSKAGTDSSRLTGAQGRRLAAAAGPDSRRGLGAMHVQTMPRRDKYSHLHGGGQAPGAAQSTASIPRDSHKYNHLSGQSPNAPSTAIIPRDSHKYNHLYGQSPYNVPPTAVNIPRDLLASQNPISPSSPATPTPNSSSAAGAGDSPGGGEAWQGNNSPLRVAGDLRRRSHHAVMAIVRVQARHERRAREADNALVSQAGGARRYRFSEPSSRSMARLSKLFSAGLTASDSDDAPLPPRPHHPPCRAHLRQNEPPCGQALGDSVVNDQNLSWLSFPLPDSRGFTADNATAAHSRDDDVPVRPRFYSVNHL